MNPKRLGSDGAVTSWSPNSGFGFGERGRQHRTRRVMGKKKTPTPMPAEVGTADAAIVYQIVCSKSMEEVEAKLMQVVQQNLLTEGLVLAAFEVLEKVRVRRVCTAYLLLAALGLRMQGVGLAVVCRRPTRRRTHEPYRAWRPCATGSRRCCRRCTRPQHCCL
jgi:hypothetical protein